MTLVSSWQTRLQIYSGFIISRQAARLALFHSGDAQLATTELILNPIHTEAARITVIGSCCYSYMFERGAK